MLENLKKCIGDLSSLDPEWESVVIKALSEKKAHELNEKVLESFEKLTNEVKKLLKLDLNNNSDVLECFAKKENGEYIVNLVMRSLLCYNLLRDFSTGDLSFIRFQSIFNFSFDNFIYRIDPDAPLKYSDYEFENVDSFFNVLRGFKILVNNCVIKQLTLNAMKKYIKDQTNFSDEMCDIIAKRVDDNMESLKISLLLGRK